MELRDLTKLDSKQLRTLPDQHLRVVMAQLLKLQRDDRKENQLLYYRPVSKTARQVHLSTAKVVCLAGGNGSSKTETALAEAVMHATGIYPEGLDPELSVALKSKWRGHIAVRVVVESLTTTLAPIILPKLQWWQWSGVDMPGGERGHWGWVPRNSLRDGSWVKSWRDKERLLTVVCRDTETGAVVGESRFQFMAKNQDPTDFASGDFHICLHDELPTFAIWRENEARTMRVNGRMYLMMTWPEDPSI